MLLPRDRGYIEVSKCVGLFSRRGLSSRTSLSKLKETLIVKLPLKFTYITVYECLEDNNQTGEMLEVAPMSTSNIITSSPHTYVMVSARNNHQVNNSALRKPIIVPKIMISNTRKLENRSKVNEEIS